ncbi:MAG: DNA-binding response regulator [Litorilinea sp.]|nr:MAG: DNA-binding response regulator [Litorilinea sp.]
MHSRVLIVDDDRLLRRTVAAHLEQAGFRIQGASSGEEALLLIHQEPPDLILLDIGLPDLDGFDLLRRLRQDHQIPVIFVTARRRELDEIIGLEIGADDYIVKPFDIDVLIAHVRAVLRRAQQAAGEQTSTPVSEGPFMLDPVRREARYQGQLLDLRPKEFDILYFLACHPHQVFTVDDILAHVWGDEWIGEKQTVYVHMRWLRRKIEPDAAHPRHLITIRGVGYKFQP